MEECFLDAEEVEGSIPSAPTISFSPADRKDFPVNGEKERRLDC